jgi:hypothetical protein
MIPEENSYYTSEIFLISKTGVIGGVFLSISFMVVSYIVRFPFLAMEASVMGKIDPSHVEMIKAMNDIHATVVLDPTLIVMCGIAMGIVVIPILSKMDIIYRMNDLKKKYGAKTWGDLFDIFRSKGMTYPWWKNDMFWTESEFVPEEP